MMDILERLRRLEVPSCGRYEYFMIGAYEKLLSVLYAKHYPATKFMFSYDDDMLVHSTVECGDERRKCSRTDYPEVFFENRYLTGCEYDSFFSYALRGLNPFYSSDGRLYNPLDDTGDDDYQLLYERTEQTADRDLIGLIDSDLIPLCDEIDELMSVMAGEVKGDVYGECSSTDYIIYESEEIGILLNSHILRQDVRYNEAMSYLKVFEDPFFDNKTYHKVCRDGKYRMIVMLSDDFNNYQASDDECALRADYYPSVIELDRLLKYFKQKYPGVFPEKEVNDGHIHAVSQECAC